MGGQKKFSFLLFVFGWEDGKCRDGKLICLIEKKNERMENEVGINLQLCSRGQPLPCSLANQHNLAFKSLRRGRKASQ